MNSKDFFFDETLIRRKLKSYDSSNRVSMSDKAFIKSAIIFLILPYEDAPYDIVMIRRTKRINDKR